MKEIKELIDKEVKFKSTTPAFPLAYATSFVKDNLNAKVNASTDYIETSAERFSKGRMELVNKGLYTCKYIITGETFDGFNENGDPKNVKKVNFFDGNLSGLGNTKTIDILANVMAHKGLHVWTDIVSGSDNVIDNDIPVGKTYKVYMGGACRNPDYYVQVDGRNVL